MNVTCKCTKGGRPPKVCLTKLLLLKSKHGSFVINSRNTDEYYSAYELLVQK